MKFERMKCLENDRLKTSIILCQTNMRDDCLINIFQTQPLYFKETSVNLSFHELIKHDA